MADQFDMQAWLRAKFRPGELSDNHLRVISGVIRDGIDRGVTVTTECRYTEDQEAWQPTGRVSFRRAPNTISYILHQELRNIDGKTKWEAVPMVDEE